MHFLVSSVHFFRWKFATSRSTFLDRDFCKSLRYPQRKRISKSTKNGAITKACIKLSKSAGALPSNTKWPKNWAPPGYDLDDNGGLQWVTTIGLKEFMWRKNTNLDQSGAKKSSPSLFHPEIVGWVVKSSHKWQVKWMPWEPCQVFRQVGHIISKDKSRPQNGPDEENMDEFVPFVVMVGSIEYELFLEIDHFPKFVFSLR